MTSICPSRKHSMETYILEINRLCQWKVSEVPPDPFCSSAYNDTKEKLSFFVSEEELILLRAKELRAIVAGILSLSPFQLLLYSVQRTCIICIVLRSVGELLFKQNLSNEQRNEFRKNHVISLQFQEYRVFFDEEVVSTRQEAGKCIKKRINTLYILEDYTVIPCGEQNSS